MIGFIIFLIVIGFVAGFLARLLVPGPDPLSVLQTWLLGVVGSFIGGFIGTCCSATTMTTGGSNRRVSSVPSSAPSSPSWLSVDATTTDHPLTHIGHRLPKVDRCAADHGEASGCGRAAASRRSRLLGARVLGGGSRAVQLG